MIEELRRLAREFREAILQSRSRFPDDLNQKMESFPTDACGHASTLLGRHLKENGFTEVQYVFNGHRADESHAWLEVDNIIVDITADQFPDVSDPVIVTEDRSWHLGFHGEQRRPAGFQTFGAKARENYEGAYDEIKKVLLQSNAH